MTGNSGKKALSGPGVAHLRALILLLAVSPALLATKPTGTAPALVLPVKTTGPSAFRDFGLEARCAGLGDFISAFVVTHMRDLSVTELSCSEGGGIGGTTYAYEFATGIGSKRKSWRLDVGIPVGRQPMLVLCDTSGKSGECAEKAPKGFLGLHANMRSLLPTLHQFVAAPQTLLQFYGQPHNSFVQKVAAQPEIKLSVTEGSLAVPVILKLNRAWVGRPPQDSVTFLSAVPASLAKCLECKSGNCKSDKILWRIDDRLFSIFRAGPKSSAAAESGARWFIRGERDSVLTGRDWQFSCGLSRYSVQHVRKIPGP